MWRRAGVCRCARSPVSVCKFPRNYLLLVKDGRMMAVVSESLRGECRDGLPILEAIKLLFPDKQPKWAKWANTLTDEDIDTVGDLRRLTPEAWAGLDLSALLRSVLGELRMTPETAERRRPSVARRPSGLVRKPSAQAAVVRRPSAVSTGAPLRRPSLLTRPASTNEGSDSRPSGQRDAPSSAGVRSKKPIAGNSPLPLFLLRFIVFSCISTSLACLSPSASFGVKSVSTNYPRREAKRVLHPRVQEAVLQEFILRCSLPRVFWSAPPALKVATTKAPRNAKMRVGIRLQERKPSTSQKCWR